jgi:hypothetical protein
MNLTPTDRAMLALIAALALAALLLRWGFRRDDGRPTGYRGRHRGKTGHAGATPGWSPTKATEDAAPPLTPTELLPSHVVRPEVRVPDADALEADAHHALGGIDDAVIRCRMAFARMLADWERAPIPVFDRTAARDRQAWDERTGSWDIRELRALVGAS